MTETLVRAQEVKTYFTVKGEGLGRRSLVRAVDGVSLDIQAGETFGLVGESGCGKSTLGRALIGLRPLTGGSVTFEGQDIAGLSGGKLKAFRKKAQLIFQDPSGSLNGRRTIGSILTEPLSIHAIGSAAERKERVLKMMETVGLGEHYYDRYPYELSGGQKQRVGIARALMLRPRLVVCDEPVSALDVSIQAQVINLLISLQREYGLTYLFISHNLNVVNYIAGRVGVMYLGKLVEIGQRDDLYQRPLHPYTQALISAVPQIEAETKAARQVLRGDVPDPSAPPPGCRFHQRCPRACDRCAREEPVLREWQKGHWAACHDPLIHLRHPTPVGGVE